jgi:hypothetical protein
VITRITHGQEFLQRHQPTVSPLSPHSCQQSHHWLTKILCRRMPSEQLSQGFNCQSLVDFQVYLTRLASTFLKHHVAPKSHGMAAIPTTVVSCVHVVYQGLTTVYLETLVRAHGLRFSLLLTLIFVDPWHRDVAPQSPQFQQFWFEPLNTSTPVRSRSGGPLPEPAATVSPWHVAQSPQFQRLKLKFKPLNTSTPVRSRGGKPFANPGAAVSGVKPQPEIQRRRSKHVES